MVHPQNPKHSARATGIVRDAIGYPEGGRFNLIEVHVEFSDGNGVKHEVVVRDNLNNLKVGMGDRVMVHYNPSSPGVVELSQSE